MSKNKYRLTKQKYKLTEQKIEYFGPIKKEIIGGKVVLTSGNLVDTKKIIDEYIQKVQIDKRQKAINDNIKKKNNKINKKNQRENISLNEDNIANSIKYSVPLAIKKEEYYKKKANIIKQIFNMDREELKSIVDSLIVEFEKEINKIDNKNFTKKKVLKELNAVIKNEYDKDPYNSGNDSSDKFHKNNYIRKVIYQRYKSCVQEIENFYEIKSYEKSIKKNERLIKKNEKLKNKQMYSYLFNRLNMNMIDIGKNVVYELNAKEEKNKNSKKLELIRQEEKLLKKLNLIITRSSNNIVVDDDVPFERPDLFGVSNIEGYEKYVEEKLSAKWGKNTEENEKVRKKIVNIRSMCYHEKISENKNNVFKLLCQVKHGDKSKEEKAIKKELNAQYQKILDVKYISSSVYKYFDKDTINKIKEKNSLEAITDIENILDNNYLPRFDKILKTLKNANDILVSNTNKLFACQNEELEENIINAHKFLLKEIYMNEFKYRINKQKSIDDKVIKEALGFIKTNVIKKKIEEILLINKELKHNEIYKILSMYIDDKAYKDIMNFWNYYIALEFYNYINEEHKYLIENEISLQNIEKVELNKDTKSDGFEINNILFYLTMDGLVTKNDVNDLYNAFISYAQFLKSNDYNMDEINVNLKSNLELILQVLKVQLSLVEYKTNIRGETKAMTNKEKEILEFILKNKENISYYTDENNKDISTKIKNLRFLEQQNAITTLDSKIEGIVKFENEENKDNEDKIKKYVEVDENFQTFKDKLKDLSSKDRKDKKGKKYDYKKDKLNVIKKHTIDSTTIENWNKNLEYNYNQNMKLLYTPIKLLKFTIEIQALYTRVIQSIERDIILIHEGLYEKNIEKFDEIDKNFLKLFFKDYSKFKKVRDAVMHHNYFNKKNFEMSLEEIYKELHDKDGFLSYNLKRKKALRKSIEYIFDKYNMEYNKGKVEIKSHQYAYYGTKDNKTKNGSDFEKIKLITKKEKDLFVDIFQSKNE